MSAHLTAGYITREVAGNMLNSVLAEFVNCPTLNVWLTESGLVQHSQESNWPYNSNGIPLIGARVIRMEISPQTYAGILSVAHEKPGAETPDPELIKRQLVRDIFNQVHKYVRLHEKQIPEGLSRLAISNAIHAKSMLDFVGFSAQTVAKENPNVRTH